MAHRPHAHWPSVTVTARPMLIVTPVSLTPGERRADRAVGGGVHARGTFRLRRDRRRLRREHELPATTLGERVG